MSDGVWQADATKAQTEIMARFTATTQLADAKDCDLVIEVRYAYSVHLYLINILSRLSLIIGSRHLITNYLNYSIESRLLLRTWI